MAMNGGRLVVSLTSKRTNELNVWLSRRLRFATQWPGIRVLADACVQRQLVNTDCWRNWRQLRIGNLSRDKDCMRSWLVCLCLVFIKLLTYLLTWCFLQTFGHLICKDNITINDVLYDSDLRLYHSVCYLGRGHLSYSYFICLIPRQIWYRGFRPGALSKGFMPVSRWRRNRKWTDGRTCGGKWCCLRLVVHQMNSDLSWLQMVRVHSICNNAEALVDVCRNVASTPSTCRARRRRNAVIIRLLRQVQPGGLGRE